MLTISGVTSSLKFEVALVPKIKNSSGLVLATSALMAELEIPISKQVSSALYCNFGDYYGLTNGQLSSSPFENDFDQITCIIPIKA